MGWRLGVLCAVALAACGRTGVVDGQVVAVVSPLQSTVRFGDSALFDGTKSFDPDGEPLVFRWRVKSRPPTGSIVGLDTAKKGFARLRADVTGRWEIELVVEAGLRESHPVVAVLDVVPEDGGVLDAGRPDAGMLDAGTPDAGVRPDAGSLVDAGAMSDGGVVAVELLDPGEVYLAGTLVPGDCARAALAHWSTPNHASTGFACDFDERTAVIRPSDGRLLYVNVFERVLREYHCDACAYAGTYPANVLANDTPVATACPQPHDEVTGFLVAPNGGVLHACSESPAVWRDAAGAPVYDESQGTVLALGDDGWLLTGSRVVQPSSGTSHAIVGLPSGSWLATRWDGPDGFYVAVWASDGPGLWRVSLLGDARLLGAYPAIPPRATLLPGARLDRAGRLFSFGRDTTTPAVDLIVRLEVGGRSEVVYTEASNPLVQIQVSSLVTGP